MKNDEILAALRAGEFDGVKHTYQPYDGYGKNSHQQKMSVSSGSIELTKITTGKLFNGKENERFKEESSEILSDQEAIAFIATHPYYFSQVRPDLF